eukprot:31424-Pelagococcus_subviridis.AAC.2
MSARFGAKLGNPTSGLVVLVLRTSRRAPRAACRFPRSREPHARVEDDRRSLVRPRGARASVGPTQI